MQVKIILLPLPESINSQQFSDKTWSPGSTPPADRPGFVWPCAGDCCCLHDYNDNVQSREFHFTGPHPTPWRLHTSRALFCSVRLASGRYKCHNTPPRPKGRGCFIWQLWVRAFSFTRSMQTPAEVAGPPCTPSCSCKRTREQRRFAVCLSLTVQLASYRSVYDFTHSTT